MTTEHQRVDAVRTVVGQPHRFVSFTATDEVNDLSKTRVGEGIRPLGSGGDCESRQGSGQLFVEAGGKVGQCLVVDYGETEV